MVLSLSSPCGYPSDQEEEMAVFESTAAEHGGLVRPICDETLQALKFSANATQLVCGPSTKTRVDYILTLLHEPTANDNESPVMEEEEDESDVEDGDITLLNTEDLLQAIDVLKKEVQRQRKEKEVLEANVRDQVVNEMMDVISAMQEGFRESLEAERALMEERCEDKITILQKHLNKFYRQELKERDQEIEALTALIEKYEEAESVPASVPQEDCEGPRRSQCLTVQNNSELNRLHAELDQCRSELLTKTQEITKLKMQLEVSGSTGSLTSAANRRLEGQQDQILMELQNGLILRRCLSLTSPSCPPRASTPPPHQVHAKQGAAEPPHQVTLKTGLCKNDFFSSLCSQHAHQHVNTPALLVKQTLPPTHGSSSHQQSSSPSPVPTPRILRGKH